VNFQNLGQLVLNGDRRADGSSVMPPEKHHDASHGDVHLGPLLLEGPAEPSRRRCRLPSSLPPHPNLRLHSQLPSSLTLL